MKSTSVLRKKRALGVTLIEMLAAAAAGALVLAALATAMVFTARSFAALGNYDDLDSYSRKALDLMSREIRQTRSLVSYQTNRLVFVDNDGAANLTYYWNPASGLLTRQKAAATTVLLTNCDNLRFSIYQRNPSNNFSFYPATNSITGQFDPTMCKLVNVTWTCSRQLRGTRANTESIQTAKIVMRN